MSISKQEASIGGGFENLIMQEMAKLSGIFFLLWFIKTGLQRGGGYGKSDFDALGVWLGGMTISSFCFLN